MGRTLNHRASAYSRENTVSHAFTHLRRTLLAVYRCLCNQPDRMTDLSSAFFGYPLIPSY